MYDPATGRFLQRDPIARSLLAPLSGTYVFADDRPTVLVDPSGRAGQGGFFWGLWLDFRTGTPQVPWGEALSAGVDCYEGGAAGAAWGEVVFPPGGGVPGAIIGCIGMVWIGEAIPPGFPTEPA